MKKKQKKKCVSSSSGRFLRILMGDQFQHQLSLPPDFIHHIERKVPLVARLTSDGREYWPVHLLRTNDHALIFESGWDRFVESQNLKDKDLLMFKYEGNSHFRVTVFGPNCLERRQCGSRVKPHRDTTSTVHQSSHTIKTKLDVSSRGESSKVKKTSGQDGAIKPNQTSMQKEMVADGLMRKSTHPSVIVIDDDDHESEKQIDTKTDLNPYFVKELKKKGRNEIQAVCIPMAFYRMYLNSKETIQLFFGNDEKGENHTLRIYHDKKCHSIFLSSGWPKFHRSCNLKAGDTCKFEFDLERSSFKVSKVAAGTT